MSAYRKAILAGLVALVGALAVAATDNHLTLAEWLVSAASSLTAVGGVYGIKNTPGDPEEGQASFGLLAMVAVITVGVFLGLTLHDWLHITHS